MRMSLPFLAAAAMLLAGPAAHAFSVETVDSSSPKAAMAADPDERLTTSHDEDGDGTVVTRHYTNADHSVSFGGVFQSARRPGYPMPPWDDNGPWPALGSGGRQ